MRTIDHYDDEVGEHLDACKEHILALLNGCLVGCVRRAQAGKLGWVEMLVQKHLEKTWVDEDNRVHEEWVTTQPVGKVRSSWLMDFFAGDEKSLPAMWSWDPDTNEPKYVRVEGKVVLLVREQDDPIPMTMDQIPGGVELHPSVLKDMRPTKVIELADQPVDLTKVYRQFKEGSSQEDRDAAFRKVWKSLYELLRPWMKRFLGVDKFEFTIDKTANRLTISAAFTQEDMFKDKITGAEFLKQLGGPWGAGTKP